MAKVRIVSNRVALPGGVTRRKGDTFEGPLDVLERMVDVGAAEWLEGGPEPEPAPEPEPEAPEPEGDAPEFASKSAAELAESEGLTAADFDGIEASGRNGYTKSDVRAALAAREA